VWVTNRSDELWVGVKCQSNVEIARSPRNALRCSRGFGASGGRALLLCGGFTAYQATANSECRCAHAASETAGANIRCREGNNPDRQLRSPNHG
jgi:hypothetical protein